MAQLALAKRDVSHNNSYSNIRANVNNQSIEYGISLFNTDPLATNWWFEKLTSYLIHRIVATTMTTVRLM